MGSLGGAGKFADASFLPFRGGAQPASEAPAPSDKKKMNRDRTKSYTDDGEILFVERRS